MKPTQEQILQWAREAGLYVDEDGEILEGDGWHTQTIFVQKAMTFAYEAGRESMKWDGIHSCHPDCQRPACVHTRKAVEAEREACAKVCDAYRDDWLRGVGRYEFMSEGAEYCADAIRARRE